MLFSEGEEGDSLHLIRRGSVLVRKKIGDHDVVLNYVAAGNYVGEMALVSGEPRNATVAAAADCETIRIERDDFNMLLERHPDLRAEIEGVRAARAEITARMAESPDQGSLIEFLVDQGGKEATDILLIDESLCVGCDNCEKACAGTHGGITRLDREAGPTYADMHVPTSCRHCEHPHCMSDCPPDAIKRAMGGEVYITDACIGCGNCERNCPYDVIQMANPQMGERGWLASLLGGIAGTARRGLGWAQAGREVRHVPGYRRWPGLCTGLPDGRGDPRPPERGDRPGDGGRAMSAAPLHSGFLTHKRMLFAWLSLILVLAVVAAWYWQEMLPPSAVDLGFGYGLGGLALAIMLWLTWFGVRKRSYAKGSGRLKGWLSAHVYLGLALIFLVPLHGGFTIGPDIHGIAYVLVLVTVFTGLFGVAFYGYYPRRVDGQSRGPDLRRDAEAGRGDRYRVAGAVDPAVRGRQRHSSAAKLNPGGSAAASACCLSGP